MSRFRDAMLKWPHHHANQRNKYRRVSPHLITGLNRAPQPAKRNGERIFMQRLRPEEAASNARFVRNRY